MDVEPARRDHELTNLNKVDWEEGWHFIRVLAQSEAGDLLPLVDTSGNPIPWTGADEGLAPRPNESDLFYVLPAEKWTLNRPSGRASARKASSTREPASSLPP